MPCMLFNSIVYPVEGLLLLFAILIPSDMKDIDYDPKEMKTIPQLIGTNNSLKLMRVLSVIGICYLIIAQKEHALPWLLSFSYLFALTFLHSKINKDYYFVWIDASFLIVGVGLYCY
jgi:4-hydroxybenzoate polyprenyltransferase